MGQQYLLELEEGTVEIEQVKVSKETENNVTRTFLSPAPHTNITQPPFLYPLG